MRNTKTASALAIAAVLSLGAGHVCAQSGQPAPSRAMEWERPEIVAVNRLPMKSTFFNFESVELVKAGAIAGVPAGQVLGFFICGKGSGACPGTVGTRATPNTVTLTGGDARLTIDRKQAL